MAGRLTTIIAVFCTFLGNGRLDAASSNFQGVDGSWQMGTFAVGNIDADAQLEIIVPSRNSLGLWVVHAYNHDGSSVLGFPYLSGAAEMNVSPTLFDMDGDGRQEIFFTSGNSVVILNGLGMVVRTHPVSSANYIPTAGYQAITNGFYMTPLGLFQPNLPPTAIFSSQVSSPIIADVDGDGTREILTAWKIDPDSLSSNQDYNPFINDIFGFGEWGTVGEVWSGGVIMHDLFTGAQKFVYHIHQLVEAGLALGQPDLDAPLEVYVLNDSDSVVCFDKTRPHGYHGNGMLHKNYGKNLRLLSGSYQTGVDLYTADLDGDGLDELLVPSTHFNPLWQPQETVLDDDGAILWRAWKDATNFSHAHGWFNNACMIPVNPDNDNRLDVLTFAHTFQIWFREWNGVELVNRPGWPKNFAPEIPTPPLVGDVDGDGDEEIIIGTYPAANNPSSGNIYIFRLDGSVQWSQSVPGGVKQIPALADVNADGRVDLVYRSMTGRIYLQDFGGTTNRISWATHRGNMARDGMLGSSLYPTGTPIVTLRESGTRSARFTWRTVPGATGYRIYRAMDPSSSFALIASVGSGTTEYLDGDLLPGWQYLYEVAAVFNNGEVPSVPFPILSLFSSNLVVNGGFEENDNSHWDKWFTGDIPWTRMTAVTNQAYQGRRSMKIRLENNTSAASINQFNQYGTPDSYLPVSPGAFYSFGGFIKSGGLSAPTEQWLEWTSTKTGEDTNNRPVFPWPNYFTPHLLTGTNQTDWVYGNRVFIMPPGFPNVELRHRFTAPAPSTGDIYLDNIFFRRIPDPTTTAWNHLIAFGSQWKYLSSVPAVNWYATNFNEAGWSQGNAKFGAGSGPVNLITPLVIKQPAYYFRRTFVLGSSEYSDLILAVTATDSYGGVTYPLELFLNGLPVVTTGIEAVSGEGNTVLYFDLTPFSDRLRLGTNWIAVKLNNTWQPTWDNIAFDLSLRAYQTSPFQEPRFRSIQKTPAGVFLQMEGPAQTIWRVDSSPELINPFWQLVTLVTNNSSGQSSLIDLLPGNPLASPKRFYRMSPF